jgi:hypothetical protein
MAERKILSVALITALTVLCLGLTAQAQDADLWGKAIDGVQVSLSFGAHPSENSSMPALRIRVKNTGASAKKIVLGSGCGAVHETNAIRLEVTDDRGEKHEFQDETSNRPCGGRLEVYEVALLPGADFSVPLSLENYGPIFPVTHASEADFEPGRDYVITAVLPFDSSAWFGAPVFLLAPPSCNLPPPTYSCPSDKPPPPAPIEPLPVQLQSNALHIAVPVER